MIGALDVWVALLFDVSLLDVKRTVVSRKILFFRRRSAETVNGLKRLINSRELLAKTCCCFLPLLLCNYQQKTALSYPLR